MTSMFLIFFDFFFFYFFGFFDQHVNIKFTLILTWTNLNWRCLSRNCFLYSFLFSCIKAIIYKNDENLETSFHLNFARLPLGWNLRYSCTYYIAKHLTKNFIFKPNPKDIQLWFKTTKVLNYISAQRIKYILIPPIQQKSKLLYNKKTIHSNKRKSQNPCHL